MVQVFEDVLDAKTIRELKDYFQGAQDRDVRPDVISKSPDPHSDTWPGQRVKRLLTEILDHEHVIEEALFHQNWTRYGVHADTGAGDTSNHTLYKAVLIPLEVSGSAGTTFFQNHWHHSSAKFTKAVRRPWQYNLPNRHGSITYVEDLRELRKRADQPDAELLANFEITNDFIATLDYLIEIRDDSKTALPNRPVSRHTWISDYSSVVGWKDQEFPQSQRLAYCDHVPIEDLHGLTLDRYVPWKVGSAIVFDRTQLHCTGNGDPGKLCLTVFTNLV